MLGQNIQISDPYVQWVCFQHHTANVHTNKPDLQLLRKLDRRTAQYVRFLLISTSHRKLTSDNTCQITRQLETAAHSSVYKLYSAIYHSQELNNFTASKAHPMKSRRYHLLGVANVVLFLLRTRATTSVALAGELAGTPNPVKEEDPQIGDDRVEIW